jgi:membrane-associated protease RseP (regulator of RpoE activity)
MATFLLCVLASVVIHLGMIAAVGVAIGVTLRVFSLGFGPTVFRAGRFRVGLVPLGGYVNLLDSRREEVPPDEMQTALDGKSTLEQLLVVLSGCVALLVIGCAVAGEAAVRAFLSFPGQFFAGALSPLREAQPLLAASSAFISEAPALRLFGVVAAKLAALNLLPLPMLNGGDAIAVLGRRLGAHRWWPPGVTVLFYLAYMGCCLSWLVALVAYVTTA